jgi:hypothetical protein
LIYKQPLVRFFSTTNEHVNVVKKGIPKPNFEDINTKIGRNQRIALFIFTAGLSAALYTIVTVDDPLSVWAFSNVPAVPQTPPAQNTSASPPTVNKD